MLRSPHSCFFRLLDILVRRRVFIGCKWQSRVVSNEEEINVFESFVTGLRVKEVDYGDESKLYQR